MGDFVKPSKVKLLVKELGSKQVASSFIDRLDAIIYNIIVKSVKNCRFKRMKGDDLVKW